jgi:hypothetical protein
MPRDAARCTLQAPQFQFPVTCPTVIGVNYAISLTAIILHHKKWAFEASVNIANAPKIAPISYERDFRSKSFTAAATTMRCLHSALPEH